MRMVLVLLFAFLSCATSAQTELRLRPLAHSDMAQEWLRLGYNCGPYFTFIEKVEKPTDLTPVYFESGDPPTAQRYNMSVVFRKQIVVSKDESRRDPRVTWKPSDYYWLLEISSQDLKKAYPCIVEQTTKR